MLTITCPNGISPFGHAEEIPQPGALGGARGTGARRARCTGSKHGQPSQRPRVRVRVRGPEEGVSARASVRVWECARMYAPDCAAIFLCEPLLSRSLLTFSHWLVNNKKEGGKRFPKKVDCKEAVGFRPLPPAGLCSAPFSVSLHLQSKLGGNGRAGGGKLLASPPILSFFFLSAFLTLVRRLR